MKRYLIAIVSTIIIVAIYNLVNIRLFTLDLTKHTRHVLFSHLRTTPQIDTALVLLNVGIMDIHEIEASLDSIRKCEPGAIGVNLCHFKQDFKYLQQKYSADKRIVFSNCTNGQSFGSSAIIANGNTVTHIRANKSDSFEAKLIGFNGTSNETEMINYGGGQFFKADLNNMEWWMTSGFLKGKLALVGYMGDYLTDSIYYFTNTRITPLNEYYGESNILPDMYDIEISGHVISMFTSGTFINEIGLVERVLVLLLLSVVCVIILTFVRTKWVLLNIFIAGLQFVVLVGIGSLLIVLFFDKGYYLALDELPLALLIITGVTTFLNIIEGRAGTQQGV
ncbi:MAG: hypothetical protein K8H85_10375 [Cyclobacteriaceae bacterium]|nr:hypothetical protein [Cyclobacteriaceae bacterium]